MIKDLRATFRQTAIYGISNVLVKATGLMLLPIYTNALSLEDYGLLVMFEVIAQFFVGVVSFNIPSAMLRVGSDDTSSEYQNRIYSTALAMLGIAVGLFLAIFLPLSGLISTAVFDTADYKLYMSLLFVSIAAEILGLLPLQLLRLREESGRYLLYFSIKLGALLFFVFYFVAIREMGVYGAVLGILLGNLTLLAFTFLFQFRHIRFVFDRKAAIEIYRFGAPLVFTTIAGVLLTIADRLIIKYYGELNDVGIYGLAYKIGSISNLLIIGSFSLGFLPIAFKKYRDPNFATFFSKMFTYFMGVTVFLTLGISVFSKEVIKLISSGGPEFWIAIVLVPFIAYVFLFKAIQNYLAYAFMLIKQTKYHASITIMGVCINIALNFLLIPKYDMYGAIAATGISYAIMSGVTHAIARRKLPIPYEWWRVGGLLALCAVFIGVGMYFNDLPILPRLAAKTALIAAFVLVVYLFIIDRKEKEKMAKVMALLRGPGGIKKVLKEFGLPAS
jgi:O-antigen/teichoic acid export membrane protein